MNHNGSIDTPFLTEEKISRMEWEKPYLKALIDHLQPSGKVLEVGFALGHSSTYIQTFQPLSHTIIESDPSVAIQAKSWVSQNPSISIIEGHWENVLTDLGVFDAIFFNDFKPELSVEKAQAHEIGNLAVQKGENLIANIKEEIPQLMGICYSDSDLDLLFKSTDQPSLSFLSKFLYELMQKDQISKNQYDKAIVKYKLQKIETVDMNNLNKKCDPMLHFLEICLNHHMHKGSRFSCFSGDPTSKFENPEFFESIITNPDIEYEEKLMPIDVPKSCKYYQHNQALIMLVEKKK
jgi:hypothetical protein